jgi:hypothetical protein
MLAFYAILLLAVSLALLIGSIVLAARRALPRLWLLLWVPATMGGFYLGIVGLLERALTGIFTPELLGLWMLLQLAAFGLPVGFHYLASLAEQRQAADTAERRIEALQNEIEKLRDEVRAVPPPPPEPKPKPPSLRT